MSDDQWEDVAVGPPVSAPSEDDWHDVAFGPPKTRSYTEMGKQFLSGGAEGIMGLASLAQDYLSPSGFMDRLGNQVINAATGQNEPTAGARTMQQLESVLPAHDPRYRYERTIGQFVGPTLLTGGAGAAAEGGSIFSGATALRPLAGAVSGAVSAQGAQDIVPNGPNIPFTNTPAIPTLAGLIGGAVPSIFADLGSAGSALLRPATPEELLGSASLAQKEMTGLTPAQIGGAIIANPNDELSTLRTTAELTGNPGMAQIEKTLSSTGQESGAYAQRELARTNARQGLIEQVSQVPAVNKEALGGELIGAAQLTKAAKETQAENLWKQVPRDVPIPITLEQEAISNVLSSKQAGLMPKGEVKDLISQFVDNEDGIMNSGALQDIRSDALSLLRDKNLRPIEQRALTALQSHIDSAMERGLSSAVDGSSNYDKYLQARTATSGVKELYGQGTPGGALLNNFLSNDSAVKSAFGGDRISAQQVKEVIGDNPILLEKFKRGVADLIPTDRSGALTTNGVKKFLQANKSGLQELLGDEHYNNFERILSDMRSQDRVSDLANLSSKGNSFTSQKQTVAGALDELMTDSLIPGTGMIGSMANLVRKTLGVNNQQQIKSLLFRAAMEPSFALELAQTPTTTRVFSVLDRLKNAGGNLLDQEARTGATVAGSQYLKGSSSDQQQERRQSPQGALGSSLGSQGAPVSILAGPEARPSSSQAARGSAQAAQQQAPADLQLNKSLFNPVNLLDSAFGPSVAQAEMVDEPVTNSNSIFSASPQRSIFSVPARMLKAVEHVESGGKADAVSNKGAVGVMQLEPIAVRDVLRARNIDDSSLSDAEIRAQMRDPDANRAIGAAYLQMLLERFDGDPELALAAYNAGPTRVAKLLKATKGDSYDDIESRLPLETRKYVPKVKSIFEKA